MDKGKYLRLLRYYLRSVPRHRLEEIMAEYRQLFAQAAKSGEPEQDTCLRLGHPREVAQGLSAGGAYTRIERGAAQTALLAAGLAALTLCAMLPLLLVLLLLLAALIAASFVSAAGGALLLVFSMLDIFVTVPIIISDLYPLSGILCAMALMSGGVLLALTLKYAVTGLFRLFYGYTIWGLDTIRGIRRR